MSPERLDAALTRLDSSDRAMLELSLRREVAVADLSELLRLDVAELHTRRDEALARLAGELEVEPGEELVAALVGRWRDRAAAQPTEPETPAEEPVPEEPPAEEPPAEEEPVAEEPLANEPPAEEPPAEPPAEEEPVEVQPAQPEFERPEEHERKSSRRTAIVLVLLVALLGVGTGVAVALLTGDDEKTAQVEQPQEPPAGAQQGRPVRLESLAGARGASGSARIAGEGRDARLVLQVKGLPRAEGRYESWLYNSVSDAITVGRLSGRDGTFQARLPADPARYRYVDVSREPRDRNPNHSGASVLRAPLAPLLGKP